MTDALKRLRQVVHVGVRMRFSLLVLYFYFYALQRLKRFRQVVQVGVSVVPMRVTVTIAAVDMVPDTFLAHEVAPALLRRPVAHVQREL